MKHGCAYSCAAPRPGAGRRGWPLAHLLVKLFIWHAIWRFGLLIWRIPTAGPGLVVLIVLALVTLAVFRARRGRGWPGPRWPGRAGLAALAWAGPGRRDPFGDRAGDEAGPRHW